MLNATSDTVLTSSAPDISDVGAADILARVFGMKGTLARLTSERDTNFRFTAEDGRDYVLKIANSAEPPEVTRFQTEALRHIEKTDPGLPVPRVVRTREGATEWLLDTGGGRASVVRLLTFLQGEPLHKVERMPAQRRNIAQCLARLDIALREAPPPAVANELQWDIKNAPKLRASIEAIPEEARRRRIEGVLVAFDSFVTPVMGELRRQVIHNDFNPHNILVARDDHSEVSGVLDFGDMVLTPMVFDLAVANAYQVGEGSHPLATVAEFTAAYHSVNPLTPLELDLLFHLIEARLATTVVVTSWRAARYPENRAYIMRNNPPAWAALDRFEGLGHEAARRYLAEACRM